MSTYIKKYFVKTIGILFCLVFQAGMADCGGLHIDHIENVDTDIVKIHFYKSGYRLDSIINYEYGPKGFSLGTGEKGQVIFDSPMGELYCLNLDQNIEYELYLCGEYVYSFASVMSFDCFKDDFEATDGLYAGWKTREPLPGGAYGYTSTSIGSDAYGNESHYLQMTSTSPAWNQAPYQRMELVSPEINHLMEGHSILLEFDVAGLGDDTFYDGIEEQAYVPELKLYLRSEGVIDHYSNGASEPVVKDKLISTLSSLPNETFVHYVIWIKPEPGYSSIVFEMANSMGTILLDNIEISDGSNFCWVDALAEEKYIVYQNEEELIVTNSENETRDQLVILSPIPAENEVQLVFEENQETVDISLFTVRGRQIFKGHYNHQERITINLEDLVPAFYIVQITTEKGQITKQLIKK